MLDPSVSQHLLHCKDILKYGMLTVTGDKFETLLQTKIFPPTDPNHSRRMERCTVNIRDHAIIVWENRIQTNVMRRTHCRIPREISVKKNEFLF